MCLRRWLLALLLLSVGTPALNAQRDALRVALHDARPVTFEFEGRPAGFGVDLVEHIAELEGWELEWVPATWSEAMTQLEAGEIDLLFPMIRTPAREKRFDFGKVALTPGWGRVAARGDVDVETVFDLEGLRVGVVAADIFGQEFETMTEALMRAPEVVAYASLPEALAAAERGEVQAVAGENNSLLYQLGDVDLVSTPVVFAAGQPYMAVPKGRGAARLARLDERLAELKADRDSIYYEAYDRWLGVPRPAAWPAWLEGVLLGGAALLLLSLAFSFILRSRLSARTNELEQRSEALLEQIRERERAETERRVLRESLRHAQKLQLAGQLASGVAHDVRNLLSVIAAHAERVRETSPEGGEQLASLDVVERAAREAGEMTRSLVAFSRKIEARPVKVDLAELVRDTAAMVERTLSSSVRLTVETPMEGVWLLADASQLRQVVLNLAVNAREAMPDGGAVTLGVRARDARHVQLDVRDTGVGMDAEVREHAFEAFYTTKSNEGGTGLGLATVKDIITEQDGEIELESAPGRGTLVRVTWPRAQAPLAVLVDGPGRGERVLVALGTRQVRQIVAAGLLSAGFAPSQASSTRALRSALEDDAEIAALVLDEAWLDAPELPYAAGEELPGCPPVVLLLGPHAPTPLPASLPQATERLGTSYRVNDLGQHLRRLFDAVPTVPSTEHKA